MYPEIIEYPDTLPVKVSLASVRHLPFHWHDAVEIIYVLDGSIQINLSDEVHLLHAHEIAIVNTNELHRILQSDQDNLVLLLQLDRAWCENILPDLTFTFF